MSFSTRKWVKLKTMWVNQNFSKWETSLSPLIQLSSSCSFLYMLVCVCERQRHIVLARSCVFKRTKCCKRSSGQLHKCWVLVKSDLSSCTHGCISWVIIRLFSLFVCVCARVSSVWNRTGMLAVNIEAYVLVFLCVYMTWCTNCVLTYSWYREGNVQCITE